MTAKGKINVAEIARRPKGTVWVLITDDPAGRKPASADAGPDSRWTIAFLKTGMTAALVTDVAPVGGNRRIHYNLITNKGTVRNLPGQQTLLLAPAPPPAEPTADSRPDYEVFTKERNLIMSVTHTDVTTAGHGTATGLAESVTALRGAAAGLRDDADSVERAGHGSGLIGGRYLEGAGLVAGARAEADEIDTIATLTLLSADLARVGEDVHSGAALRLARGIADGALTVNDAVSRLRDLGGPRHIRPRADQTVTELRAALGPAPVIAFARNHDPDVSVSDWANWPATP